MILSHEQRAIKAAWDQVKRERNREQVAAIRATPKTYGSGRALAEQYGVSETVISRLRSVSWCGQNGVALEHFEEMAA